MSAVYYSIPKESSMRSILLAVLVLSITVQAQSPSPTDEVKAIQNDARLQAAFDHIDKNRDAILREWIAITEINAPSKQEQERARYIESPIKALQTGCDGVANQNEESPSNEPRAGRLFCYQSGLDQK